MAQRSEKSYGIPHTLGEHGGIPCGAPTEKHSRCEMCGACYTCAGVVRQVTQALGVPEPRRADETDEMRIERIVRFELADAGAATSLGFSGVISVESVQSGTYQVIADRDNGPWVRFLVDAADSDEAMRIKVRNALGAGS